MIKTDSMMAADVLARIETDNGAWTEYGGDGRFTTSNLYDTTSQNKAGVGFRARFIDGPYGGDYGWGPLAQTAPEAIALMLAEYVAGLED